jgi:hypothetical protein
VARAIRRAPFRLLVVGGASLFAAYVGLGIESSSAQQKLARNDAQHQQASRKPDAAAPSDSTSAADAKPMRRSNAAVKGPYYVDFRARTAASYGHAFVWYGKSSERQVEVAGLHPKGDVLPYVLGHLMWVPSETGASYGDLDEQYLTASYRVYLNEADAKKVFAHIKHLQATSPVWNAQTTNCTSFIGRIASFMGLKTPFHIKMPEDYVNQLKEMNGGRSFVQLASDH